MILITISPPDCGRDEREDKILEDKRSQAQRDKKEREKEENEVVK